MNNSLFKGCPGRGVSSKSCRIVRKVDVLRNPERIDCNSRSMDGQNSLESAGMDVITVIGRSVGCEDCVILANLRERAGLTEGREGKRRGAERGGAIRRIERFGSERSNESREVE